MNTADSLRSERYLESGDEAGTSPADRKYRPDVEGLRAVAILLVLLGHFDVPGTSGGFLGVDIFFVISGFVVTGLLIRGRASAGRIQLADFFARRCRRIIPLAATVIVLTMILQRVLFGRATAHFVVGPARLMLLFVYNVSPSAPKAWIVPGNIAVYWSLCVEEQFYLIYPLLLIAVALAATRIGWRSKAVLAIAAVTVASFAWTIAQSSHGWSLVTYISTLGRVWELGLGCLLAFSIRHLRRIPTGLGAALAWSGAGLIVIGASTLRPPVGAYPSWSALLPALGAVLIIAGGTPVPRWGPERVLGLSPMRKIGQWSYGAYLWEIPIITALVYWRGSLTALPVVARLAFVAATLGVAGLSFSYFESPIRHSRALARSSKLSFLVAGIIVGLSLVVVTVVGQ